jgi:hypothetical protein
MNKKIERQKYSKIIFEFFLKYIIQSGIYQAKASYS